MESLDMQGDSFDGAIRDISRLVSLRNVEFSNNNLSGSIPQYLETFLLLQNLNLSLNKFEGSVSTKGVFQNGTTVSVFENENVCGGDIERQLKPCTESPRQKRPLSLGEKVAIGISVALLFLFINVTSRRWFKKMRKKNNDVSGQW